MLPNASSLSCVTIELSCVYRLTYRPIHFLSVYGTMKRKSLPLFQNKQDGFLLIPSFVAQDNNVIKN